jgi:hypothetical protein
MVKINEFHDQDYDNTLPFDVVDDVAIFMRNDPMFYRKTFFPAITNLKNCSEKGEKINPKKIFGPMINDACTTYCRKFNIPKRPEELLDDNEKDSLIRKLYSEEMTNIRKGVY